MSRTSTKEKLRYWPTRTVTLTPGQVNANTTSAQTFAAAQVPELAGLRAGDLVKVVKAAVQNGVYVADAWVATDDQLTILFANCSAGNLTPSAGEEYTIVFLGSY
jgi:hypothetical protein